MNTEKVKSHIRAKIIESDKRTAIHEKNALKHERKAAETARKNRVKDDMIKRLSPCASDYVLKVA